MQHGNYAKRQETVCGCPNGLKHYNKAHLWNQRFFRPPIPFAAASISPLLRILPSFVYTAIYHNWAAPQISVLRDLLRSPAAIYACLTLADEEMKTITRLDKEFINEYQHKLWMYFAEHDDWVGDSREEIVETFHSGREAVCIVRGEAGVPHAFCISESNFSGFVRG